MDYCKSMDSLLNTIDIMNYKIDTYFHFFIENNIDNAKDICLLEGKMNKAKNAINEIKLKIDNILININKKIIELKNKTRKNILISSKIFNNENLAKEILKYLDIESKKEIGKANKKQNKIFKSINEKLDLTNYHIKNQNAIEHKTIIQIISEYKNIASLNLTESNLDNIDFLYNINFSDITELNLSLNKNINNFLPLTSLKELKILNLEDCDLNNLAFIQKGFFTKLTNLNLNKNKRITDYTALTNLQQLTVLHLAKNNIEDISFLSHENLQNIQNLDLSFNDNIIDFNYLTNLQLLNTLNLSITNIQNISFLSKLSNLAVLDLHFTDIIDCTSLTKLKKLKELNLKGSNLNNMDFLKDGLLESLIFLDISDCDIEKQNNLNIIEKFKDKLDKKFIF